MNPKAHTKDKCPFVSDISLLQNEITHMKQGQDDLKEIMTTGFKELKEQFKAQNEYNEKTFVQRNEFSPIQKLVYGFIIAVLGGALGFALKMIYGW